jgi:hypothetical protein
MKQKGAFEKRERGNQKIEKERKPYLGLAKRLLLSSQSGSYLLVKPKLQLGLQLTEMNKARVMYYRAKRASSIPKSPNGVPLIRSVHPPGSPSRPHDRMETLESVLYKGPLASVGFPLAPKKPRRSSRQTQQRRHSTSSGSNHGGRQEQAHLQGEEG